MVDENSLKQPGGTLKSAGYGLCFIDASYSHDSQINTLVGPSVLYFFKFT